MNFTTKYIIEHTSQDTRILLHKIQEYYLTRYKNITYENDKGSDTSTSKDTSTKTPMNDILQTAYIQGVPKVPHRPHNF